MNFTTFPTKKTSEISRIFKLGDVLWGLPDWERLLDNSLVSDMGQYINLSNNYPVYSNTYAYLGREEFVSMA